MGTGTNRDLMGPGTPSDRMGEIDDLGRRSSPKVAVIIVNWNGRALTSACLDALKKITYPNYTVILVDNGSTDGSGELFRNNYDWVLFIENRENLGFAGGNNVGIREALRQDAAYILLLNNDTVVDPAFLTELVKAAEEDRTTGFLGPKIYYHDRPDMLWYAGGEISLLRGLSRHYGFREIDRGQYDEPRYVSFVTGCSFLVKREVIQEIGLLDEVLFCYAEDSDWCLRAAEAGYRGRYVPTAKVWHVIGASTRETGTTYSINMGTRNALYVVYKHASGFRFLVFFLAFFINVIIRKTIAFSLRGDGSAVKGLYRGLGDFIAMPKKREQGRSPRL